MSDPTGPVTLGDLSSCGSIAPSYERDVNPSNVPLPADTPVPEVSKKMKCSEYGSRKINTKPELYPGGILAMRARRL
jgi:hypothetical protein